tara:strand:- start:245 stop:502 length:258 start_codon:yes stop_codon:yes gene_type:complete
MDKAKEILTEWLTQVDSTHIKEGHITVILNAMEEYADLVNKTNDIHDVSQTLIDYMKWFDENRDMYYMVSNKGMINKYIKSINCA